MVIKLIRMIIAMIAVVKRAMTMNVMMKMKMMMIIIMTIKEDK